MLPLEFRQKLIGKLMCVRTLSPLAAPLSKAAFVSWKVLKKLQIIKCYVSWTFYLDVVAAVGVLFSFFLLHCIQFVFINFELLTGKLLPSVFFPSFGNWMKLPKPTSEAFLVSLLTHPLSILFTWHENINFISFRLVRIVHDFLTFVCPSLTRLFPDAMSFFSFSLSPFVFFEMIRFEEENSYCSFFFFHQGGFCFNWFIVLVFSCFCLCLVFTLRRVFHGRRRRQQLWRKISPRKKMKKSFALDPSNESSSADVNFFHFRAVD